MQYAMQVFETEDHENFRVIDRNGEPWFFLTEVCKKLEIANSRDAASRLDDDERDAVGITDTIGRTQQTTIINESGLYSLILSSRKPEAKRFKKWITSEVLPTIRKTGAYHSKVPAFIQRYNRNWDRVTPGYFSVINELAIRLWGRLEMVGHIMRDVAADGKQLRPDVSVGQLFSKWLQKNHPTVCDNYTFYNHVTDEWSGDVRQYPNGMLPMFIEFLDTIWIPQHSERYFNTRDPAALPHLPRLMPPVPPVRIPPPPVGR